MARSYLLIGFVGIAAATAISSPHGAHEPSPISRAPEATAEWRAQHKVEPVDVHFTPPSLEGRRRFKLWATHYSIPRVYETRAADGVALLDIDGNELGPKLSPRDFCRAAMEGTVAVLSKKRGRRLYDFDGVAGEHLTDCTQYFPRHGKIGKSRFKRARAVFGSGAGGRTMVPYRTVAVDPRLIPLGSVLYVPAARGAVVTLENGETQIHDGYFYAADTGGSIDGNHVDVFIGYSVWNPFSFVKSHPGATFDAYVIESELVREAMLSAHAPPTSKMISKR